METELFLSHSSDKQTHTSELKLLNFVKIIVQHFRYVVLDYTA